MAKSKLSFICNNCNNMHSKWSGKCNICNSWNSITECKTELKSAKFLGKKTTLPNQINIESLDTNISTIKRFSSNLSEIDRILGGGIVPGSVILIGGDPGVGKSTMLLQLVDNLQKSQINTLYVSGEESSNQIKLRASRLGIDNSNIQLSTTTAIEDLVHYLADKKEIQFVVIDSIQTMYLESLDSPPGTVTQIRSVAMELIEVAKKHNITIIIVGHITKDGQIAGPKIIEHMVDAVLYFEGEKESDFRILRCYKNRFGPVSEIAILEMTSDGIKQVKNPSEIFLKSQNSNAPGSVIFATSQGSKTLLVEIQTLTANTQMATPRRAVVGWDTNRLAIILAVLSSRCNLDFSKKEVYLNVVGGLKILEPAADLAVATALISSLINVPLQENTVVFGEVGLSGETRAVSNMESRINEAKKLGFKNIIIPHHNKKLTISGINIIQIKHLRELIDLLTK